MKTKITLLALLMSSLTLNMDVNAQETAVATQEPETVVTENAHVELTEEQKYAQWAQATWDSMEQMTGEIKLANGVATLNVPENFYYLSPKDSKTVLEDVWGNPPGLPNLGMLFPAEYTPFDGASWAVTIEYEADGYVSDEDADEIDYVDLLNEMKESTAESSKARIEQGYQGIELVGWASTPYYDKESHKLHWAKEIRFDGVDQNTLNYNIRVLGRKGVLVLNFIASMEQRDIIDSNLGDVLAIAEFDQGSRYIDFDPDMDEVAAYGLGALIAGKAVAKTGLIAALLIFLKKFGVFIVVGIGVFAKKMFSRKSKAEQDSKDDS